jgi:ribosomal protein S18 acetylase RimI-like enzyme
VPRESSGDDPRVEHLLIRPWVRADRDAVQALLRLLSDRATVAADDAPTYVALREGRVVGMVTVCIFRTLTGSKASFDHLVVAPTCRRQGIGRALVSHAIREARAAGASRVDLTAGEHKPEAHALYESLGFRRRDTGCFRLSL